MHAYTSLWTQGLPTNKSGICSLDFTVNRVFMKLFRTGNIEVVRDCQVFFNFDLPIVCYYANGLINLLVIRAYRNSGNDLCKFLCTS